MKIYLLSFFLSVCLWYVLSWKLRWSIWTRSSPGLCRHHLWHGGNKKPRWTQIDIKSQVMPAFTIFRFLQQIQTLYFVFYLFLSDCFPNSPMLCNYDFGQIGSSGKLILPRDHFIHSTSVSLSNMNQIDRTRSCNSISVLNGLINEVINGDLKMKWNK